MASPGQPLSVPRFSDVVAFNRQLIARYGGAYLGTDNLHNPGSLEWVLDAIQHPLFGQDLYPTLAEKAAMLAWTIIDGHVFFDGNHRTGMLAALTLIRANGHDLLATEEEVFAVADLTGRHREMGYSREDLVQWFSSRLRHR